MLQKTMIKWVAGIVISGVVMGGGYFAIQNFGTTARLENAFERIAQLERQKATCEIARKTLGDEVGRLKTQITDLQTQSERMVSEVTESKKNIQQENDRLQQKLDEIDETEVDTSCEGSMNYLRDYAIGEPDEQ